MNSKSVSPYFSFLRLSCHALFFIMVLSCGHSDKKPRNEVIKKDSFQAKNTAVGRDSFLNVTAFTSIPDTIDGCGDFYMLNSEDIESGNYIFLSNMSEVAIMIIDRDTAFLNIDTTKSRELGGDGIFNDVFRGSDGLTVELKVKMFDEYEEGAFFKGELIIHKGSRRRVYKIHGQSGC
ncbi:MAG: hypothetical protein ABWZ25_15195 [Chitinophagaceae bacterium]